MARSSKNRAASYRRRETESQQRQAEGAQRPAPGLSPALTHDEWMAQQAEKIEAAQKEAEGE